MNDDEETWWGIRHTYRMALLDQYESHPEYHGKIWRPKTDGSFAGHIPMSFSMTLLGAADGIWNLERQWEMEP